MRIGCFGLNANPPHLGHAEAAMIFRYSGLLDEVWLIPSFEHPFSKPDVARWEQRVHMCCLLEHNSPDIWVSLAEAEVVDFGKYNVDKSYTIYTLQHLRQTFPVHKFYWCICSDIVTSGSYRDWHRWDELEKEDMILVAERSGYPVTADKLPKPFKKVGTCCKDIASTQIRAMIREGKDVAPLTGTAIAEYIRLHKLYSADNEEVA